MAKTKAVVERERKEQKEYWKPRLEASILQLEKDEKVHRVAGRIIVADWCLEQIEKHKKHLDSL
jgi:hypothetical protein